MPKHVSYCGGVEIQYMPPTVVEWKYGTSLLLCWSGNTDYVFYCGGVEIQNISPTVVVWKYRTCHLLWWSEIQKMSPTVVEWKYRTCLLLLLPTCTLFHSTTVGKMFCISTPSQ
jgi:hypothetical protein